MATAMEKLWWSIGELAARWHVSADTIRRRIKDGELRAMQVGGAWRVHQTVIEERERQGLSTAAKRDPERKPRHRTVKLPDLVGNLDEE
jgi:excisionase family DNA binding protein